MWFSCELIRWCLLLDVPFVLENPVSSRLFRFPPLAEIINSGLLDSVVFDACAYGAPWRKSTRLIGTLKGLSSLGRRCPGCPKHTMISGSALAWDPWQQRKRWQPVSQLAGVYEKRFCTAVARLFKAEAVQRHLPLGAHPSRDAALASCRQQLAQASISRSRRRQSKLVAGWRFAPAAGSDADVVPPFVINFVSELWRRRATGDKEERHTRTRQQPQLQVRATH